MSYRRSSPLSDTATSGRPRESAPGGTTTVTIKRAGSGPARTVSASTTVRSYRGATHVVDMGTAVNYGSHETEEHRLSQDPAAVEEQAALQQQAAAEQAAVAQVASRKKYLTIGAVVVAGAAAFFILRRKKGTSS